MEVTESRVIRQAQALYGTLSVNIQYMLSMQEELMTLGALRTVNLSPHHRLNRIQRAARRVDPRRTRESSLSTRVQSLYPVYLFIRSPIYICVEKTGERNVRSRLLAVSSR